MSDYAAVYRSKLRTPEQAAELVPARGNHSMGMGVAMPPALTRAVADRARAGDIEDVRLYYMHPAPVAQDTILAMDVTAAIKPHPFYIGPIERALVQRQEDVGRKVVYYVPGYFHQVAAIMIEDIGIDAHMVGVSPMDRHGYFSFGTNGDYSIDVARNCKKLLVEVNENMPRTFGYGLLHISEVDAIVENTVPLVEYPPHDATSTDAQIAEHIRDLIPEHACVQFGIGGVPDAVCATLKDHKDLGIHTELLTPSMIELIEAGDVSNKYKRVHRYKTLFNLALGPREMYEFIDDNPSMEVGPASYVNDPAVIGQNDNVISVNSFIEVDLLGQVNAEFLLGHQFSAPGGQMDFVRGAQRSKGGKSFLAATSTAAHGKVSRIVPRLSAPITDPRMEVEYVVTEFGICNLRGKSSTERAQALIETAHPSFREELTAAAEEAGFWLSAQRDTTGAPSGATGSIRH
jgi:itaconate CoA-transferase